MPIEAQNSFLKTLEEPPGRVKFIMTTNQISQVLPTILSRVRQVAFASTEDRVIEEYIKATYGPSQDLPEIINMAQGRPGLAISLTKNRDAFMEQRKLYNQIEIFLKKNDLASKFLFVEELEKDPARLEQFFDALTRYLRKLLFEYTANPAHPLKSRFSLRDVIELFEVLEKTRYLMERNVNKKLALENLMIATERG
jgi:DNA polymerase-3 subunit delta'